MTSNEKMHSQKNLHKPKSDAAHVLNYFQSGTGQLTEDAESAQQGITRT